MKDNYLLVFGYTKLHSFLLKDVEGKMQARNLIHVPFYRKVGEGKMCFRMRQIFYFFWYRLLLLSGKDVSILLPHPEHLLANYFFFSKKISSIFIYEDGLMNYLHVDLPKVIVQQSKRKSVLAWFFLYKYQRVVGYLSGCEQRVIDETYVRLPKMMYMPEKHGVISSIDTSLARNGVINKEVALFVDQDIESVYDKELANTIREKIYTRLGDLGKVYIKPHHNYWSKTERFTGLPPNFEILSEEMQALPAEEVAAILGVGSVWGYFSSALINISTMLPDVNCFSCTPECHLVNTVEGVVPISLLLEKFGVKPL